MAHADKNADEAKEQAKLHYEQGEIAFRLGKLERAAWEFSTAYELSRHPVLLYNLAQVYRQLGNLDKARWYYKQFLSSGPSEAQRAEVEKRVLEIDDAIKQQEKAKEAPPTGPASPGGASEAPKPAQPGEVASARRSAEPDPRTARRARTMRIAGVATLSGGVLLLGLGGAFVGLASVANSEITGPDGRFDASAEDRRNAFQAVDAVFFATGGVAVAAGLTLYLVGRAQGHRSGFQQAATTSPIQIRF
jgi:iron complex outermembrane receptor protein